MTLLVLVVVEETNCTFILSSVAGIVEETGGGDGSIGGDTSETVESAGANDDGDEVDDDDVDDNIFNILDEGLEVALGFELLRENVK